jgi:hypothetical protein
MERGCEVGNTKRAITRGLSGRELTNFTRNTREGREGDVSKGKGRGVGAALSL